jgi:hypothetical protein
MRVVREPKRTVYDPLAAQAAQRKTQDKLRAKVFGHYGLTCACCGTAERLSIDHVNGGGRQHREEVLGEDRFWDTAAFYRWLVNNDFPDGFQTLCCPCNSSKKTGERCRKDHSAAL